MATKEIDDRNQAEKTAEEPVDLDPKIEEDLNEHDSFEDIRKVGADPEEDMDSPKFYQREKQTSYQLVSKKSKKKTLTLVVILALILLVIVGLVFRNKINSLFNKVQQTVQPTPTPTPTLIPTPTPNPWVRSDWSLEVLNGSGVTGQAKALAEKLIEVGYPVVKTGNADKQNYEVTQILVKKELLEKVDLVVADLKDAVKIASMAGELKEGTASARIIIGKDYNP